MKKLSTVAEKLKKLSTIRRKCMCLATISSRPAPKTLIESGWKEFGGTSTRPAFQNVPLNGSTNVPLDQWITAEEKDVTGATGGTYKSGFHIYADEKELLSGRDMPSRYRRVYYRRVHTIGKQNAQTIAVAREMYVASDPDAWPPQ